MFKPVALVIEDHESVSEVLTAALKRMGCTVLAEADGDAGLRTARSTEPDLVLVDMRLPGLHGVKLVEELRRYLSTKPPAVIALTGYASANRRERLLASGCDAFFEKPVDLEDLARTVSALLRRS